MLKHLTDVLIALGPAGMLALAFLDSTGIPVSAGMDALMIFLAVQSPASAWISALLAVVGSAIGNLVLFTAARKGGKRFLEHAAKPGRAQKFRHWFERYGLVTVFVPAFVPFPLPLKLFVISAGVLGTRRSHFLTVVVLARVLRYGSEVWLGMALGKTSEGFLKTHIWHFALGGVALFAALYILVWFNDSARKAAVR
jgi:membrane protein YqaA with SNARE-associated domain